MKTNRQITKLTQLSDSWVLWFETSNQYIVISNTLLDILKSYLNSSTEKDFLEQVQSDSNISLQQAEAYYNELTELLNRANSQPEPEINSHESPLIPNPGIEEIYCFANKVIKINYGSEGIKALIHPQWAHATDRIAGTPSTLFDIFQKNDYIFLYRNKDQIGHYPLPDYHLLQGQFALQLINTLYDKKESDWVATFHASTVCNDKEAIMIIGDSGNGKSTLSAVLMAHGIDVLADDFTPLLAENAEVYRFPSGISVKEGAFSMLKPLFQDFDEFPVYRSTSKPVHIKYIPPISRFGEGISHVPCHKIVFVNYDAEAASEMKAVATDQILPTLIPESWLSPLASNAKIFLDWLKDVQCYELNYSDNAIAVSEFKTLFNS